MLFFACFRLLDHVAWRRCANARLVSHDLHEVGKRRDMRRQRIQTHILFDILEITPDDAVSRRQALHTQLGVGDGGRITLAECAPRCQALGGCQPEVFQFVVVESGDGPDN